MTPTEPVCSRTELPVVDVAALPGYLHELEQATDYLDESQRALLRRTWATATGWVM